MEGPRLGGDRHPNGTPGTAGPQWLPSPEKPSFQNRAVNGHSESRNMAAVGITPTSHFHRGTNGSNLIPSSGERRRFADHEPEEAVRRFEKEAQGPSALAGEERARGG